MIVCETRSTRTTRRDHAQGCFIKEFAAPAQIVLWRADGHSVADIVKMSGATKPTVCKWLDRYESHGLEQNGLVTRQAFATVPVTVEDSLTPLGENHTWTAC